ncbi:probable ATP-dependent RNA helicase DHX37 isoform X1 [Temnothorax longispinosus]|uniref:probable ATP-dependent RNA helicase DHX37 isoform X1 n=1 Tax=Temnothorax longispinosus TaxID=300112 RepID=UPI003A998BF5
MGTTIDGYRASVDGVKWFAYFFLEGQVYPKLKRFVPSLLTTPGSITKSWARLIPRTQAIVQTLQSQGVVSKYKLLEIWGLDEKFWHIQNVQKKGFNTTGVVVRFRHSSSYTLKA